MADLIQLQQYLGKYQAELKSSADQEKYIDTELDLLLLQKFKMQSNRLQMIVDSSLSGLQIFVAGNEVRVSKELYDHPGITTVNTVEDESQVYNPRADYNPDVFSSMAYLICQNHTKFKISSYIDRVIYVRYRSEFETFYNSIITFEIDPTVQVDIVEEFESSSAINIVTNYHLAPTSRLRLHTFYRNSLAGIALCLRNVVVKERAYFRHLVMGKGSSSVVDETKIYPHFRSNIELFGVVEAKDTKFHSVLTVHPSATEYRIAVEYRNIINNKSKVSYYAGVKGDNISPRSSINVEDLNVDTIPAKELNSRTEQFIKVIVDNAVISNRADLESFHNNKTRFLYFK